MAKWWKWVLNPLGTVINEGLQEIKETVQTVQENKTERVLSNNTALTEMTKITGENNADAVTDDAKQTTARIESLVENASSAVSNVFGNQTKTTALEGNGFMYVGLAAVVIFVMFLSKKK